MPAYADLELGLRRRDARAYTLEMRYNAPDSEADQRLLQDNEGAIEFDLGALRALEPDWSAYGTALAKTLFTGPVASSFSQARNIAQAKDAILRVRLYIEPGAAELHNLHWETLRDPDRDAPLFTSEQVAFSRYLASMDWRPVRPRPRADLKALVAVASPSNITDYGPAEQPLAPVDSAGELARAQTALDGIEVDALVGTGATTLENLGSKLRDGYDILYLVCHGALIEQEPRVWEPRLYLEKPDGRVAAVSGSELVRLIQDLPERPRVIVLASCQSAGSDQGVTTDPGAVAAALGPQLAQAGVPAVVAMRGNISMETVARFMPVFFTELRRDGQIDRAMAVARHAVQDRHDYWIPVLYMRLRSGRIWYVAGFTARENFDSWKSICGFVSKGTFVPIVGPELSEHVFGSVRDTAARLANDHGFPLSSWERADPAKVAQYVATNSSVTTLRDDIRMAWLQEICAKFPDLVTPDISPPELIEKIVSKLYEDPNNPYRILANLNTASVYVSAVADPLLAMFLRKAGRSPVELVCKWRDERREAAGAPELKADLHPDKPLLYYVYGKSELNETWVITEDDFFDYLIRTSKHKLMPWSISFALTTNSLMFLGFPLDDWKFRILFRMILDQGGSALLSDINHVGVQVNPDESTLADANRAKKYLERYFRKSEIDIYWGTAADFLREMTQQQKNYAKERPQVQIAASARAW